MDDVMGVAQGPQSIARKVIIDDLRLLQADHIRLQRVRQAPQVLGALANRINVPGNESHIFAGGTFENETLGDSRRRSQYAQWSAAGAMVRGVFLSDKMM